MVDTDGLVNSAAVFLKVVVLMGAMLVSGAQAGDGVRRTVTQNEQPGHTLPLLDRRTFDRIERATFAMG